MRFFQRKTVQEKKIEQEIQDMKLYLENNYKDLAIAARKNATQLVETFHNAGQLKEESYQKYVELLESYTKEMEHYNHQEFYHS